ncbi:hypothetical protein AMATHDRAFT_134596 [Amanita thiersii Skay4041]|uniref:Transmembrane protein 135 N-terminal domain-containing protein n=1 Tax=Amanita thiersii Skay4041 TaxID=703135 RepID=A0A2A9P0B3_9AGAR|nr:hypothetical protein AMATHDRAFT_134596 [Amanita thiersii Skay4041]
MRKTSSWLKRLQALSNDPAHPAQIALRTYALALSFSLLPSLIPFLAAFVTKKRTSKTGLPGLKRVLRREFGHDGFAFSVTLAVGGGALIRHLWRESEDGNQQVLPAQNTSSKTSPIIPCPWISLHSLCYLRHLTVAQKTFLSYVFSSTFGVLLLQAGRRRFLRMRRLRSLPDGNLKDGPSPTLDLTLLLAVRAIDAILQAFILRASAPKPLIPQNIYQHTPHPDLVKVLLQSERDKQTTRERQRLTSRIDALIFWACSARIMWCFFYEPQRLPRSYVKWIGNLANVDGRLLQALSFLRDGKRWSYLRGSPEFRNLLATYAQELGHPAQWGDPLSLPAIGGQAANVTWQTLGVKSRPNIGGIPCEIVHGHVGQEFGLSASCTANAFLRGVTAFLKAVAIYLPAHFVPVILTRPWSLLKLHRAVATLIGALRSATFLSTFVASYWYAVCLTRTLFLARLFPWISHDFWDGPYGCLLAGSLACGNSIWIENGRRRGEMALYVLPKALRACLPDSWITRCSKPVLIGERIAFILSLSSLLTAAVHRPDSLRGLSRWTLAFVMNGPNAGFWKRKREAISVPPTPTVPLTPGGGKQQVI